MEKIDYEKLIDPLCIPVIKILREELDVDTRYCCQGSVREKSKRKGHALGGYIAAILSPKSERIFIELTKSLGRKTRSIGFAHIEYNCLGYNSEDQIILRLKPYTGVSEVWGLLEDTLKELLEII